MMKRKRHGKPRASRPRHGGGRAYKVVCSACGKEAVLPVPPPNDKKLLCIDCFNKKEMPKEET